MAASRRLVLDNLKCSDDDSSDDDHHQKKAAAKGNKAHSTPTAGSAAPHHSATSNSNNSLSGSRRGSASLHYHDRSPSRHASQPQPFHPPPSTTTAPVAATKVTVPPTATEESTNLPTNIPPSPAKSPTHAPSKTTIKKAMQGDKNGIKPLAPSPPSHRSTSPPVVTTDTAPHDALVPSDVIHTAAPSASSATELKQALKQRADDRSAKEEGQRGASVTIPTSSSRPSTPLQKSQKSKDEEVSHQGNNSRRDSAHMTQQSAPSAKNQSITSANATGKDYNLSSASDKQARAELSSSSPPTVRQLPDTLLMTSGGGSTDGAKAATVTSDASGGGDGTNNNSDNNSKLLRSTDTLVAGKATTHNTSINGADESSSSITPVALSPSSPQRGGARKLSISNTNPHNTSLLNRSTNSTPQSSIRFTRESHYEGQDDAESRDENLSDESDEYCFNSVSQTPSRGVNYASEGHQQLPPRSPRKVSISDSRRECHKHTNSFEKVSRTEGSLEEDATAEAAHDGPMERSPSQSSEELEPFIVPDAGYGTSPNRSSKRDHNGIDTRDFMVDVNGGNVMTRNRYHHPHLGGAISTAHNTMLIPTVTSSHSPHVVVVRNPMANVSRWQQRQEALRAEQRLREEREIAAQWKDLTFQPNINRGGGTIVHSEIPYYDRLSKNKAPPVRKPHPADKEETFKPKINQKSADMVQDDRMHLGDRAQLVQKAQRKRAAEQAQRTKMLEKAEKQRKVYGRIDTGLYNRLAYQRPKPSDFKHPEETFKPKVSEYAQKMRRPNAVSFTCFDTKHPPPPAVPRHPEDEENEEREGSAYIHRGDGSMSSQYYRPNPAGAPRPYGYRGDDNDEDVVREEYERHRQREGDYDQHYGSRHSEGYADGQHPQGHYATQPNIEGARRASTGNSRGSTTPIPSPRGAADTIHVQNTNHQQGYQGNRPLQQNGATIRHPKPEASKSSVPATGDRKRVSGPKKSPSSKSKDSSSRGKGKRKGKIHEEEESTVETSETTESSLTSSSSLESSSTLSSESDEGSGTDSPLAVRRAKLLAKPPAFSQGRSGFLGGGATASRSSKVPQCTVAII